MSHAALRSFPPRRGLAETVAGHPSIASNRPFATVEAHGDPRSVMREWRALAEAASASPYQSPDWLTPWIETIGVASGVVPFFVLARDAQGAGAALLPLGLQKKGGLSSASFLGAKDSNFNMGLFRPGVAWTRDALHDLLGRAAAESGATIDLYAFRNQPQAWEGTPNPLAALRQQPSPSFAYKATLTADAEAFLHARLSREARKKVRQKAKRLGTLGPVSIAEAVNRAAAAELIDAFVVQRMARNAAAGIVADDLSTLRRFLERTVGDGAVSFYGLRCGDRIVATLAGTQSRKRFCGMLMSFDADPEVARNSPGELLLSEVLKRHCAAGHATFDLGIGEARYKESYCPEIEPLFDSIIALTAKGRLFARAEATRLQVKRAIKQSRWAWPLVQRARRAGLPVG